MKEMIVQLGNEVALTSDDISKAINGLTNQDSGFIALKDMCKKENLNTNATFEWLRSYKGWLKAWPEVTAKAIKDWALINNFTNTLTISPSNILIMIISDSHYVNTNSSHYEDFIVALNSMHDGKHIKRGYNRVVKKAIPELTRTQKIEIRKDFRIVTVL